MDREEASEIGKMSVGNCTKLLPEMEPENNVQNLGITRKGEGKRSAASR